MTITTKAEYDAALKRFKVLMAVPDATRSQSEWREMNEIAEAVEAYEDDHDIWDDR